MTSYDQSFDPPAPIAKITLRNVKRGERVKDISVFFGHGSRHFAFTISGNYTT